MLRKGWTRIEVFAVCGFMCGLEHRWAADKSAVAVSVSAVVPDCVVGLSMQAKTI